MVQDTHSLQSNKMQSDSSSKTAEYVVVGHCCESGDVFTQKEGGEPMTRIMGESTIGDYVVIGGVGVLFQHVHKKLQ